MKLVENFHDTDDYPIGNVVWLRCDVTNPGAERDALNAATALVHGMTVATNTYAKTVTGLQRTLAIQWIVHNFIRRHFSTNQVPAVALGILEKGLSWEQMFTVVKFA